MIHKDRTLERYHRAPANAPGLEKRGEHHHPQPRRVHANDLDKHLPSTPQSQKDQIELCRDGFRPRGRDGSGLAFTLAHLRILLAASKQLICRGALTESVHNAAVRAGVPRLVRF